MTGDERVCSCGYEGEMHALGPIGALCDLPDAPTTGIKALVLSASSDEVACPACCEWVLVYGGRIGSHSRYTGRTCPGSGMTPETTPGRTSS